MSQRESQIRRSKPVKMRRRSFYGAAIDVYGGKEFVTVKTSGDVYLTPQNARDIAHALLRAALAIDEAGR